MLQLVRSADPAAVVRATQGLGEGARRAEAAAAWRVLKLTEASFRKSPTVASQEPVRAGSAPYCARLLVLATSDVAGLGRVARVGWNTAAADVLASRSRAWLEEALASDLARPLYPALERLSDRGLLTLPASDAVVLGLMGLPGLTGPIHDLAGLTDFRAWDLCEHVADRPSLVPLVLRFFEVEGDSECSLAAVDKYDHSGKRTWSTALHELARRGVLDRADLVEGSLNALAQGWAPFRSQWMRAFHVALELSTEEKLAHQDNYRALLASPTQPSVTMALDQLLTLEGEPGFDVASTLRSMKVLASSGSRTSASKVLRFAARVRGDEPEVAHEVLVTGLEHSETAVQELAAALGTATSKAVKKSAVHKALGPVGESG